MRAEHHDLVGAVRARNLGDDVERVERVVDEAVLNVQLECDGHASREQPRDPVVVLGGDHELRATARFLRVAIRRATCRPASAP